ncbi:hypothetical protein [Pyrococcus sp. ST04]|uniref:hypothetical protein n=1 Tax=Pyrococcus sp. ST04 TaxID=1183377 RepID=UPI0002605D41|nr:hypothetical protein [Pyrococcus sp. ST04]AFK22458.1 hypothetical protein Py04_0866 [Pyrococcus sp. ST04]
MKVLRRRILKENVQFLTEVIDKMAKNGVIREDVIEEVYWTLKKLLKDSCEGELIEAFEEIVMIRSKLGKDVEPERHLEKAKVSLSKFLEGG